MDLNSWMSSNPALAAATLTGSVTFIAGISAQVLSHYFTKKREIEKSREEAFSKLYSPLSIEVYKYLTVYGKKPEAKIKKENKEVEKVEKELNELWGNITKLIADNKQAKTLELSHNFIQINRDISNNTDFAKNFFKEYKKMAKKIKFKGKIRGNTTKNILNFIELYYIVFLRYGPLVAPYVFQAMDSAYYINFKKTLRNLSKEKFSRQEHNRIPFDDIFETLVINNLKYHHRGKIQELIDYELTKRQERLAKETPIEPKEFF
ncbi:hypothetical protein [Bacillus sp. E214]|uniref:hypothetical protein n=1 Tax=Bacillus sp. E214 TaxID=2587156 RepID=UPI0011DF1A94|nr:hypothetical protein [Bacillus sp. E214]